MGTLLLLRLYNPMILIRECSVKTYRVNFLSFIFQFIVLPKTRWIQSSGKTLKQNYKKELEQDLMKYLWGNLNPRRILCSKSGLSISLIKQVAASFQELILIPRQMLASTFLGERYGSF